MARGPRRSKRRIRTIGMEPAPMTPESAAYVDAEITKAEKL
jgi:hypothetical protein